MYCIVDIETTGGNHKSGKITEIAIVKHDGLSIIEEYSTLVNPECNIPYFITNLTGINNEMVRNAPRFYEVARDILEHLGDNIFIAHNVSFDYGFIREEFRTLGYTFKMDRICTVKSARKVFPGLKSYSLGKLCNQLDIPLDNHHRALADAKATAKLWDMILKSGDNVAKGFLEHKQLPLNLNPSFDTSLFRELPESPGVYYFINSKNETIYIGKSNNIRKRVMSHFRNKSKRGGRMIRETVHVDYEQTGSELIALLKESDEIKEMMPRYNRKQKRSFENVGLYIEDTDTGYKSVVIKRTDYGEDPIAVYKNVDVAKNLVRKWTEQFGLCQKYTSLHPHKGPCFGYHVSECRGACVMEEDIDQYNTRLDHALSFLKYKHESFAVIDQGRSHEEVSVVLVDRGKYQGYGFADNSVQINSKDDIYTIIDQKKDNRDTRGIIRSYLQNKKIRKLVPL